MAQQKDETIIEYARRAISWLDHNDEIIYDKLPDTNSLFELFDLISDTYDVSLIEEVYLEILESDADPKPLEAFIAKYDLNWNTPWKEAA